MSHGWLTPATENEHWTAYRLFFAGAFPGIVIAYFTIPPGLAAWEIYAGLSLAIAVGVGSFYILHTFVKVSLNKLTALYAASAISIFYWYAAIVLAETLLNDRNHWSVWILRVLVLSLALLFVWRTWKKEEVFLQQDQAPAAVRFGGADTLKAIKKAQTGLLEVSFEDGVRVVARPGQFLSPISRGLIAKLSRAVHWYVPGADPICVKAGMENLSPPTRDEQATLERLGLATSTRMACCAKFAAQSPSTLRPSVPRSARHQRSRASSSTPPSSGLLYSATGSRGLTAADHVRRRHPDCSIDIVAAEPHPLYNRMGITRLIYGRSAMVGLPSVARHLVRA